MLIAELKTRPNVVLKENNEVRHIIYPSNEKEVKELEMILDKSKSNEDQFRFLNDKWVKVNMSGYKNEVHSRHVEDIIPTIKIHNNESMFEEGNFVKETCCYQEHKSKVPNNVIKHEDKLSSFYCALELIKSDYFIVLEEDIELEKLNNIVLNFRQEENAIGDQDRNT